MMSSAAYNVLLWIHHIIPRGKAAFIGCRGLISNHLIVVYLGFLTTVVIVDQKIVVIVNMIVTDVMDY